MMLNKIDFILLFPLVLLSCSNDGPEPEVFMQIASITNETDSKVQQITYDSYGKVISYSYVGSIESIKAEYEYISDNLVKITTKDVIFGQNGDNDIIRIFRDDLHLENGRAVSCDGIFSQIDRDKTPFEKKYRHEFSYTSSNLLNTVKCTEWSRVDDKWAEDKPWTWENFYYWENGNLVKIEDYLGHSYPCITYTLKYADISNVQNVVPIQMGRYQYFPLQLKGIFGSSPVNLIKQVDEADIFDGDFSTFYQYDVVDKRIEKYQEIRKDGVSSTFSVQWTK